MAWAGVSFCGHLDRGIAAKAMNPPGLLSRIFSKPTVPVLIPKDLGKDQFFFDYQPKLLKKMHDSFKTFLKKEVPNPNSASKTFNHSYLGIPPNTYLRLGPGKDLSDENWYVQFSFSGCAGMAEVSMDVAAHWAALWAQKEHQKIQDEFFAPLGFTSDLGRLEEEWDKAPFLPIKSDYIGYVKFRKDEPPSKFEIVGSKLFSSDESAHEVCKQGEVAFQALDAFAPLMESGHCHCQMCDPSFEPVQVNF